MEELAPESPDLPSPGGGSFEAAWRSLFATSYKVACRILGQRAEAEDVVQDALAKARLRWGTVAPYAPARVAAVSANAALSRLRRDAMLRRLPLVGAAPASAAGDLRCDLVRALRRLSHRQREVFVLLYVAELWVEQVADRLGCSTGSVKQHAHRARRSLRVDLRLDDEEDR